MPVDIRRVSLPARLMMAGLVVLALLPVCVMIACTGGCGCGQCASHHMEPASCPETSMTLYKSLTTLTEPLVFAALITLVAALVALVSNSEGRLLSVQCSALAVEPHGPPDPRYSRLLI